MDTTHRSTSAAPTRGRRPLRLAATVGALALALAIPLAVLQARGAVVGHPGERLAVRVEPRPAVGERR
uniref:hypothetical protein n=1 Tax=Clavibacter michiganensis TaxID=28447 RepID=UPI002930C503